MVFVRAGQYFGPDRRRRDNPAYMGAERRKAAEESPEGEDAELSQEEVEALLNG